MSVKEANALNFYFLMLSRVCQQWQRRVSAGELALYVGVSRSTAQKYLRALKKNGAVEVQKDKHWNGHNKSMYSPIEGAR